MFVTGTSAGATTVSDYATVAYDAATGTRLWARRYHGPGHSFNSAVSLAVSPGGGTVFVTGFSTGAGANTHDYATVAYKAATGARLWVRRYNGPANSTDAAASVAVSPTGRTVFVTGTSAGATTDSDYATVAYDAATGTRLWAERYNGPGNSTDFAASVAVSRGGRTVFVTGQSTGVASSTDYATVAYSAATGAQLWARRYNGPANGRDTAVSVAVSPAGGRLFVTGTSEIAINDSEYATVAYSAATGAWLWTRLYHGPGDGSAAFSVAVSPARGTVFVTGFSAGAEGDVADYATIAYSAATGARLWINRYNGARNRTDAASSVAVSPDGATVFVTGTSEITSNDSGYATVAYRAVTGAQLWARRYHGPRNGPNAAASVAVSPAGGRVSSPGKAPEPPARTTPLSPTTADMPPRQTLCVPKF